MSLANQARAHVALLASDGGKEARARLAARALVDADTTPNQALAVSLLAGELERWAGVLVDELGTDDGDPDRDGLATLNRDEAREAKVDPEPFRVLWLDAALVRVLAKVDADEARKARATRLSERDDPEHRWKLWRDVDEPAGLVGFLVTLWRRKVEARWRRGVDRPAAIVRRLVADRLLPLMGRRATINGGDLLDGGGNAIARFDVAAVDPALVRRGLAAFRTTIAHKLIRFLALEAHAATVRGDGRPEVVRVEGGLAGLASILGRTDHDAPNDLRDILAVGRSLDLSAPGLEVHGLWHGNTVTRHAPGQRSMFELVLNERVFLPGTAFDMKASGDSRPARRARLLVPVLQNDPPHRTPNRNEWGLVWSAALGVLVRMVDGAPELVRDGGVLLDAKAWAMLVDEAGLDRGRVSVVRSTLLEGDGVARPLLERVGPDRFTLANDHASELAFIVSRVKRSKGDA